MDCRAVRAMRRLMSHVTYATMFSMSELEKSFHFPLRAFILLIKVTKSKSIKIQQMSHEHVSMLTLGFG